MGPAPFTLADAAAARRAASAILGQDRYHQPSIPRPLHGLLHSLGVALSSVGHWIGSPVRTLERIFPGGATAAWVLLVVLLMVIVAVAARGRARRALERGAPAAPLGAPGPLSASDLERMAQEAERGERFAAAVRLRFQAGLTRLEERGEITGSRSTPTDQLARALASADFDALAARFDQIAYGDSPADAQDLEEARRRWPGVLAGRRR